MTSFSVPPATVEITDGDITRQLTDAIVNAANNHLWMGAGVAGAIKARGGDEIERDAMALGPIQPGECVVTTFGRVPIPRFVIHATVMGQDLRTTADFIKRATENVLATAAELRISSVAMPALGTGVGGFPIDECARVMLGAIRRGMTPATTLRQIRVILFGQAAYHTYAEVAGQVLGRPLDGAADCPVSG